MCVQAATPEIPRCWLAFITVFECCLVLSKAALATARRGESGEREELDDAGLGGEHVVRGEAGISSSALLSASPAGETGEHGDGSECGDAGLGEDSRLKEASRTKDSWAYGRHCNDEACWGVGLR